VLLLLLPYQIGSDNHPNQRHGQQIDHFPASNLFFAISTYSGFISIPILCRPCFSATRPVVPEPKNGSRTMPRPLPSLPSHWQVGSCPSNMSMRCARLLFVLLILFFFFFL